ncbi:MAG TPA: peptide-binding protein [Symbiobacteriaceae bacterium]|jgi:peptide/nickel transport system substrate-binding protein
MRRTRFSWLIVASLVVMLLVSACTGANPTTGGTSAGPAGEKAAPQVQGNLVYASSDNPVSFNPILLTDSASYWVAERVFSSLVNINVKLEPVGDLAIDWTASPDGLQWTFRLRKDVKFHDGQPFTAEDVAFTYNTIKDKTYTGPYGAAFKWLDRVEVVDPYTAKFILKESYAPFITTMTFGILPKHLYDAKPVAEMKDNPANRKPVGTGPWKFGEWVPGQYIALTRNDSYYAEGPYIPDVRLKFVADSNVSVAQLEAGEIGAMLVPSKDVKRITSTYADKLSFYKYEGTSFEYICFNLTRPGLMDKAVRHAIAYAVDRQKMVTDILEGEAVVMDTTMAPGSWAYTTQGVTHYTADPKKSMAILEQAGYVLGTDGIYSKDGKRLSFTLITNAGHTAHESVALLIQKELKDVGIEIKTDFIENSVMLDKYVYPGNFDLFLSNFGSGIDPDQYSFFHSSQAQKNAQGRFVGYNRASYSNPEVDRLLEDGRKEPDKAKRAAIYARYQQIIADDIPWLVLYSPKNTYAVKKQVKGVISGPIGPLLPRVWYSEQP